MNILLCVQTKLLKLFVHVPLFIKYAISRRLLYASILIQLYKYYKGFQLSLDQIVLELDPIFCMSEL